MSPPGDRFIRPSELEIAWGYLPGQVNPGPQAPEPQRRPRREPVDGRAHVRRALEAALRPALERSPAFVTFSGGRDSSVVLAVALAFARREGLPEPVALTKRYPGVSEADETEWQEMVIRHLGIPEWVRVDYDELDFVGRRAGASLVRYGVLWPPRAHVFDEDFELARGGSLITGDGGDELFGMHRSTPLAAWIALGRPNTPSARRSLALALGPPALRRWRRRKEATSSPRSWLRRDAARALVDRLAHDAGSQPFDFRRSVARVPLTRSSVVGLANLAELAADRDVRPYEPLLDHRVAAAVADAGGRFGFSGRSAAMRALFDDLLPDPVLARTTKAHFTTASFDSATRSFASNWNGLGLNAELVDPAALRAQWAQPDGPTPHAGTALLLQQAWLQNQRQPATPP